MRVSIKLDHDDVVAAVRAWLEAEHDLDLPESVPILFEDGNFNKISSVRVTTSFTADTFKEGPYR